MLFTQDLLASMYGCQGIAHERHCDTQSHHDIRWCSFVGVTAQHLLCLLMQLTDFEACNNRLTGSLPSEFSNMLQASLFCSQYIHAGVPVKAA